MGISTKNENIRSIKLKGDVPLNKYGLNHNYFDNIDSEHKAYILGFLYADGNVSQNKYYITIDLSYDDVNMLDYISNQIYNEQPPYFIREINNKKYCKLQISSKHMANKLVELGCVPNKTDVLKFPNEKIISQDLQRHFIRGYFDGDGSITFRNNNPMIYIIGNKDVLEKMQVVLKDNNVIESNIVLDRKYYRLQITGLRGAYWFYCFMYDDINSYYYKRKKDRFDLVYEKMSKNKDKIYSSNTRGVYYDKSRNKWKATYGKKQYGRYSTEEEAINKRKEIELYYEKISNC